MNTKQLKLILAFAISICSVAAHAQVTELDKLYPGYEPTVFNSYEEVVKVFNDDMPMGFRMGGSLGLGRSSQCYQRAELWSYNFYRNYHINAMKVFVFYTHAYRQAYRAMYGKTFDWWFHVTPYLLVRDPQTQQIEEYAVDATFTDAPLKMKPWTDLFVETKRKCAEFVPFTQFKREVQTGPDAVFGKEHCYIVRVPASDYDPTDLEARATGEKTGYVYGRDELEQAVNFAPTNGSRGWWRAQLGL